MSGREGELFQRATQDKDGWRDDLFHIILDPMHNSCGTKNVHGKIEKKVPRPFLPRRIPLRRAGEEGEGAPKTSVAGWSCLRGACEVSLAL